MPYLIVGIILIAMGGLILMNLFGGNKPAEKKKPESTDEMSQEELEAIVNGIVDARVKPIQEQFDNLLNQFNEVKASVSSGGNGNEEMTTREKIYKFMKPGVLYTCKQIAEGTNSKENTVGVALTRAKTSNEDLILVGKDKWVRLIKPEVPAEAAEPVKTAS